MRFIHVSANMCVRKHKKSSSKKTSPVTNLAMTAPSILKAYANHYTSTNSQLSEEQQNEQEHSMQLRNSMYDTSQYNHEHTLLNHDTMYHNNNSNSNNHSNSTITSSHPNHELHHVLDVTNPHNTHAMSNKMVRAGSSSSINACNDRVGACKGDDHGTLQQPLTTNRRGSIASSTSTASNACMECTSTNQLVPSSPHASSNNMMIKNGRVCSPSTLLHSSNNNHACTSQIRFVMEDNFANTAPPKKRNILTKHQIIRVLHLSQAQACKILGCSISTLKRRFGELKHELGMEKWPSYFDDVRHLPVFPQLYPMSLSYILNEENVSP
ncbi:hypothetical protein C9374_008547 [Naegleria lovaniensis]|uniref:RWP-RK domain-containing protein n=1 Tax=Naegleria lovaniensis TaxID=51637 RepID=A0AA88KL20_NAELO|nr:uncharacterized protein C9374_008547 [Naegleria lovaniensis]KAG2378404.1 hypothetical protein C9374_008547 [Naegleria lovaniensis]